MLTENNNPTQTCSAPSVARTYNETPLVQYDNRRRSLKYCMVENIAKYLNGARFALVYVKDLGFAMLGKDCFVLELPTGRRKAAVGNLGYRDEFWVAPVNDTTLNERNVPVENTDAWDEALKCRIAIVLLAMDEIVYGAIDVVSVFVGNDSDSDDSDSDDGTVDDQSESDLDIEIVEERSDEQDQTVPAMTSHRSNSNREGRSSAKRSRSR